MRSEASHPSLWLDRNIATQLRIYATEAERNGVLYARQLDLVHDHKWFRMFVPQQYGGAGMSLVDALRIEEALAWADGSTAWVVTFVCRCRMVCWFH